VLDTLGSKRAAVLASTDAGPTALLFAASEPERTQALVLFTTTARFLAADDYPGGLPEEFVDELAILSADTWGTPAMTELSIPSMARDEVFTRWTAKTQRLALSPREFAHYLGVLQRMDVRQVLPMIRVPTLVIHRAEPSPFMPFPVEHGRYLADHIPGAKFVIVPGTDMTIFTESHPILEAAEEFLTGASPVHEPDRVLASVLFTDIVSSTERAAAIGDKAWKELLQGHDALAETIISKHRGRFIKSTGDGVLATFDGPGRAIRCAEAFREALKPLDIEIRMGLHTGEVELRGADIGGIGVHVAARVLEHASPGELLTSAAVPMLVTGSGIEFDDRGEHSLKGIPGDWRLFAVRSR
jgi:class 3 adenylate cyclase